MKMQSIILSLFVLFASVGGAFAADVAGNGLTVLSIDHVNNGLFAPFVIATTNSVYKPGDVVNFKFQSDVPYNTKSVTFRIEGTGVQYSKDVSSLFSPATTSWVTSVSFTAPNTAGTYKLYLDFRDANTYLLYTDVGAFSVQTSSQIVCSSSYCSTWTNSDRVQNGWLQSKSCYTIAQDAACTTTYTQSSRISCDSDYVLQNGRCVTPTTPIECGNNKIETGETCDKGALNGVCPAACNLLCQTSNCASIPGYQEDGSQGQGSLNPSGPGFVDNSTGGGNAPAPQNTGDYTTYIIIGIIVIGAAWFIFSGKKK